MRGIIHQFKGDDRAIALPMAAIMFAVLLAFTGLVLDGGRIYFEKRKMQPAADAAALGGAHEVRRGNTGLVVSAAREDAKWNRYEHGTGTIQVDVFHPPVSGNHVGDDGFVEVVISEQVPAYFMRILNYDLITVRARAVAGVGYDNGMCVLVTDPDDRRALRVSGVPRLEADCGIMVNSDHSSAIEVNGQGELIGDWVGTWGEPNTSGGGTIEPSPVAKVPPMADPFLSRPEPQFADFSLLLSPTAADATSISSDITLQPGYYPNEINITGGTVRFESGVYFLNRGLRATGGRLESMPGGTSFFNYNANDNDFFHVGGNVSTDLYAWSTDDVFHPYYAMDDMLLWNRRDTRDVSPGHLIRGTSESCWGGIIYVISQHVDFSGNTNTCGYWNFLVANTLDLTGNAGVQNISGAPPGVIPELTKVSLVE